MTEKTKKNVEQSKNDETGVFINGLLLIIGPLVAVSIAYRLWPWIPWISYIPAWPFYLWTVLFIPLVLYFYWAKNNVIGYFIEEGYAIVFAWSGKAFAGADLQYGDAYFDSNWNIVFPGEKQEEKGWDIIRWIKKPKKFFGMGLYAWPFKRVYKYKMTWSKRDEGGNRVSKTEELSRVLLKPYVYDIAYQGMEDKDRMPLNIELATEIQVRNPYKALFGIERWYRALLNLAEGEIRRYIGQNLYLDLVSRKEAGEKGIVKTVDQEIVERIRTDLNVFEEKFGVKVNRIKLMQIFPSRKEDIEATLLEMRAKREREAIETKAKAEAYRAGQELAGIVLEALKVSTGKSIEVLQEEYRKDPKLFEQTYETSLKEAYDFAKRRLGFTQKGRFEFITSCKEGEGSSDTTSRLAEIVAGVEMARNQLQLQGKSGEENKKKDKREGARETLEKIKKELGHKE